MSWYWRLGLALAVVALLLVYGWGYHRPGGPRLGRVRLRVARRVDERGQDRGETTVEEVVPPERAPTPNGWRFVVGLVGAAAVVAAITWAILAVASGWGG